MKKIVAFLTALTAFAPAGVLAATGQNVWGGYQGYSMMSGGGSLMGVVSGWFVLIMVGLVLVALFVLLIALIQRVLVLNGHHQHSEARSVIKPKKPKRAKKAKKTKKIAKKAKKSKKSKKRH